MGRRRERVQGGGVLGGADWRSLAVETGGVPSVKPSRSRLQQLQEQQLPQRPMEAAGRPSTSSYASQLYNTSASAGTSAPAVETYPGAYAAAGGGLPGVRDMSAPAAAHVAHASQGSVSGYALRADGGGGAEQASLAGYSLAAERLRRGRPSRQDTAHWLKGHTEHREAPQGTVLPRERMAVLDSGVLGPRGAGCVCVGCRPGYYHNKVKGY